MNTENSETNGYNKFFYEFTDKVHPKNLNKNISLPNLMSIYYTQKNIKSAYNNNKFKISALNCNDKFDQPGGSYSVSDIQDYFEYIVKKHETVEGSSPIQI